MFNTSFYSLHCFSVLARLLNYTKAAEVLNVTQPALSKMIRTLEKELGFDLFIRNTRSVKLTEAGQFFLEKAVGIINDMDQIVYDTDKIARGQEGILKIGFLPYTYSEMMPKIVVKYHTMYSYVNLTLLDGDEYLIEPKLKRGELDIALVSDWGTSFSDEYVKKIIYEDDYCAVVSVDSELAQYDAISFEMLKNQNFIVLMPEKGENMSNYIATNRVIQTCIMNGIFPNIINKCQANSLLGLSIMAGSGEGVAILASHMEKFVMDDYNVKFIPIVDMNLKFHAVACYKKNNLNSCIQPFLEVIDSLC